MTLNPREKQIAEAEELLAREKPSASFAKGLFFGQYRESAAAEYPGPPDAATADLIERLRRFCHERIDPVAIDRQGEIPDDVISGLGQLGVLGACLPTRCGGLGLSQTAYCRLLQVLGGHCASTALFVNAHHSIGPRALALFGTREQQDRWLPKLCRGDWLSAFALTEPEAGSDAANVQTRATPTADGYILSGEKRWITNGALAHVLTVMARTPVPGKNDSKITAFVVTPDMPGFEVLEARMEKCGVRGTATSRLAFRDMRVPKENILGPLGGGLKVALTVLDYGRTTFGASCAGAARFCVERAAAHARARVQFGQNLGSFELVKEKLAHMSATTWAMEAATFQTAALIDAGGDDYMLETAMLKVFATETLWRIVNDTIQIYGGKAYFTDEPFERMMRDARINMIGEGANDVLRAFVALVGMRDVGVELKGVLEALQNPLGHFGRLGGFAARKLGSLLAAPRFPVASAPLEGDAERIGRLIGVFGAQVEKLLRRYQEAIVERQYQLGRVADAVIEIYVSCCVLRRLDRLLADDRRRHESHDGGQHSGGHHETAHAGATHNPHERRSSTATAPVAGPDVDIPAALTTARYYLATAERRIRRALAELWNNDDEATTAAANLLL